MIEENVETAAGPTVFPPSDPFQAFSGAMAAHLTASKPWVRFMAVMGFIMAGLLVVVSLITLMAAPFMETGPAFGAVMSLVYLLIAAVYVVPSLYLNRFASSIAVMTRGGGPRAMAEALDHQRRFWRVAGIITIAMLCFYALAIFVGIVFGVIAALAR
jgi:hypothetical protein